MGPYPSRQMRRDFLNGPGQVRKMKDDFSNGSTNEKWFFPMSWQMRSKGAITCKIIRDELAAIHAAKSLNRFFEREVIEKLQFDSLPACMRFIHEHTPDCSSYDSFWIVILQSQRTEYPDKMANITLCLSWSADIEEILIEEVLKILYDVKFNDKFIFMKLFSVKLPNYNHNPIWLDPATWTIFSIQMLQNFHTTWRFVELVILIWLIMPLPNTYLICCCTCKFTNILN